MHLRIQVPALDESPTIAGVLRGALSWAERAVGPTDRLSALVVDDGSADDTAQVVRDAARSDPRITLLSHPTRQGLGATFRTGLAVAVSEGVDVLVHIDADGQFDPAGLPALVRPVLAGHCDVACASRFADAALVPPMPPLKRWGNRAVTALVSGLTRRRFTDVSCGFRAFGPRALAHLAGRLQGDFTYTHESLMRCAYAGLRITEVSLAVAGRRAHGRSRVARSVWSYGLRSGGIILRTWLAAAP